jgi:PTH1 family peptidyl-tRNA hydrolase
VRIGVGHPGVKDAVAHYVLHDFAKAEYAWLDPLLDAIAASATYLAKGDPARFLSHVAQALRAEATAEETPSERKRKEPEPRAKTAHPAGERAGKRAGALAENLKKWLAGRSGK